MTDSPEPVVSTIAIGLPTEPHQEQNKKWAEAPTTHFNPLREHNEPNVR